MRTKQLVSLVLVLITAFGAQSCKKKGCTDNKARNYDMDAKKDDGSCTYSGTVVFWYNNATEDSLNANGYYSEDLIFMLDEKPIKNSFDETDFSFSSTPIAPECSTGLFSFTIYPTEKISLGSSPAKQVNYAVLDQAGATLFSGTKEVKGGICNDIQLKY